MFWLGALYKTCGLYSRHVQPSWTMMGLAYGLKFFFSGEKIELCWSNDLS